MTHLTITLDEATLERARCRAQEEGTSVDALLRSYLEAYSSSAESREPTSREPFAALRALSGAAHSDFTNLSTDKYAHAAAAVLDSDE
jgi:hypothetical protein